jgi:hypothetical protein
MPRKQFDRPDEPTHDSNPFNARYPGRCEGDCGGEIEPGDEVSYVDDQLMHTDCQPRHWPDGEKPPICPHCWLQHAGECP